ncbi:MAG: cytochrome c maturation protein CcmE [Proteobacteria bacterium]|nr:cytochrome c maturation protein CcmE [Pseudomonadota bacterium]MDA0868277.1 cytochrome c maturation protein CcmE [Pseudomonadota bacterium]MDA1328051.1 cytochrome c maturation protein CcmE [Pseudomonadota bacterium]
MTARQWRLLWLVAAVLAVGAATTLVLRAFESNLVFFYSPTQVAAHEAPTARAFRVGGLVQQGSVQRASSGLTVNFVVTDGAHQVPVRYTGMLPDLFREGKGVVAQGRLDGSGWFVAQQVLAKHDENYMPPEAAAALQAARTGAATQVASQP